MIDTAAIHALIAATDRSERAALQELLLSLHLKAEEASSLEEALGALERFSRSPTPLNLVFLTPRLSDVSGFDCAREIRASHGKVVIIMLGSPAEEEHAKRYSDLGIAAFLSIPLSQTALLCAVSQCQAAAAAAPRAVASGQLAERMKALIPGYLTNRRKDLEALRMAISQEDYKVVARVGHNLKGTGGPYGFPEITQIGRSLEQSGKEGNAEEAARDVARLASYLESIKVEH